MRKTLPAPPRSDLCRQPRSRCQRLQSPQSPPHCNAGHQQVPVRVGRRSSFAAAELACWPHRPFPRTRQMHCLVDCSLLRYLDAKQELPLSGPHAWAMLGEWAGQVAFPIAAPHIGWPRHGHGKYLRPAFIGRTLPFLTWARPIFGQGALSPMSTFPADFPILCLPGDKLFQSKEVDSNHSLPPIVHAFQGNKVTLGRKLQAWQEKGLAPLGTALLAVEHLPPLWTHSNGCDFVRGGRFVVKPRVAATRVLTPAQVLLLQSLWVPVQTPHQFNTQPTVDTRLCGSKHALWATC